MNRFFCQVFGVLLAFGFTFSHAAPNYEVNYKSQNFCMSQEKIIELANDTLHINSGTTVYSDAIIYAYSKNDGKENYLVVDLLQPNQFGISTTRLDVDVDQYCVTKIQEDYVEEEPLDPYACGTCPDPDVQVLIAYITEFQSSTLPAVNKAESAFTKAKLKVKKLKDGEENKNSLLDWLSCPKLIMWTRVGHGNVNVIRFGPKGSNGNMSADEFLKDPFKSVIKGKYYPFCSCYVAGGQKAVVGRNLIKSGGRWMCGGDDVPLYVGPAESAWANFLVEICNGTEVASAFDKQLRNLSNNKWGCQSDNKGPYYPFKGSFDLVASIFDE